MKKLISLFIIAFAAVFAVASMTLVVFTCIQPKIEIHQLLNYLTITGRVSSGMFLLAFVFGFISAVVPSIRLRLAKYGVAAFAARIPWYIRACQLLFVAAMLMFLCSPCEGIHFQNGKTMRGWSNSTSELVGSDEAVSIVWVGIRQYSALAVAAAMIWMQYVPIQRGKGRFKKDLAPHIG